MEYGRRERIISLLYPRRCPACHDIVEPKGACICAGCRSRFSYVKEPLCMKCGKEITSPEQEYCYDCTSRERDFVRQTALMNYDKIAQESMVYFKYKGRREYADFYVEEIMRQRGEMLAGWRVQLILPVPIHASRLRERGYNQAEELAVRLGRELAVPVRTDLLIRARRTEAQKRLSAAARQRNLERALEVTVPLSGVRRVLLVDDIYTTGSTLQACTRVLRRAGVREVYGCTVCIGRDS